MKDILEKILDLEKRAQGIVDDAKADRQRLESELDAKVNFLKAEVEREKREELQALLKDKEAEKKERLEYIEKQLAIQVQRLEDIKSSKKDEWVNAVFEGIFA